MKSLNKTILTLSIILFWLLTGFAVIDCTAQAQEESDQEVIGGTVRAQEESDFEATGGTVNFDANKGVLTVTGGPVTIKNKNDGDSTNQRIVVDGNAEVTLEGVNIDASNKDGSAFSITSGKAVTLILKTGSSNVLTSSGDYAGLHVPETASLTINGPGTLVSKCYAETGDANGAGIGGSAGKASGKVTIEGGTVTASCESVNGNANGAGIGGGGSTNENGGDSGKVTITGGTVKAICTAGTNDKASDKANGAGIGGGGSNGDKNTSIGGNGGDVTIDGGNVMAVGGTKAEKIGCGYGSQNSDTPPDSGSLQNSIGVALSLVTLDTITYLSGGDQPVTNLWVGDYRGNVTPNAAQKIYGIKDMKTHDRLFIYLYLPEPPKAGDFVLTGLGEDSVNKATIIYTGKIEAVGTDDDKKVSLYQGIDLSCFPKDKHLFIGKDQFAISPDGASGTVDYSGNYTLKGSSAETLIQNTVTVLADYPGIGNAKTITLDGLNIDVSSNQNTCAFAIKSGASVSLLLNSKDNSLISGADCAGLNVPEGASLEITTNDGSLNAVCKATSGEAAGAGIGGNKGENCGEVKINSGNSSNKDGGVNAICQAETGNASGAGIGGGNGGNGGAVTITGSTITAICEAPNGTASGAGIGGGAGGSGAEVIINGGNVKAVGGSAADAENIGRGSGDKDSGSLKNSNKEDVYLNIFTLSLSKTRSTIDTLTIGDKESKVSYSISGVNPLDISSDGENGESGKLYFYLPASVGKEEIYLEYSETITVRRIYTRSYTRKTKHMAPGDAVQLLQDTSYKVTIPAEIRFDSLSYKEDGAQDQYSFKDFGIAASGLDWLVAGRSLSVRVSGPGGEFALTDTVSQKKLPYKVFEGDKERADFTKSLGQGGAAVSGFIKDDEGTTKYATLRLDQSQLQYSGGYSGTLTFTVNIDDKIE